MFVVRLCAHAPYFEKNFHFCNGSEIRSEEKQINFCIKRMQSILMRRATTRLPQLATAARVPQLATVTRLPPLSLRSRTQSTQAAAAGRSASTARLSQIPIR